MIPDRPISRHFSLYELTTTSEHPELQEQNRDVPPSALAALAVLTHSILEPIRRRFGPVHASNGYRCPALNLAVGSKPTSQHPRGEAADLVRVGRPGQEALLIDVWRWIRDMSGLPFGTCILEDTRGTGWNAIHLGLGFPYRTLQKSGQAFTMIIRPGKPPRYASRPA